MIGKLKALIVYAGTMARAIWDAAAIAIRSDSGSPGVRVYYGFSRLASSGEKTGGGLVKLGEMQDLFPNTRKGVNTLYLVSSSLHSSSRLTVRFARRSSIRVILNQNGVAYPAWHGPGWEQANRELAFFLHAADHVFYQSEFCRKSADRFLGARSDRWEVLHNAVDTQVLIPPESKPAGVNLLLAGSHNEFYRIRTALDTLACVLKKVPEATLTIAGRFNWRPDATGAEQDILRLCSERGVSSRVDVVGAYSQRDAVALFQDAHILVHPQYNDACPRLVLEAMSCGVPVAYSASGGVPELVGRDAGIGVPAPEDWEILHPPAPEELASAVAEIVADLAQYSRAARRRAVERFDVRPWLERHRRVFRALQEKEQVCPGPVV